MTEMAPNLSAWATNTEQIVEAIEFPRIPIFPRAENYARLTFQDAFDVPEVLQLSLSKKQLPSDHIIWLVDFASHRKDEIDQTKLDRLDNDAHREAQMSPDFLKYFRGDPDPDSYCRSFCTWASMLSAKASSHKELHSLAAGEVDQFYNWYQVKCYEAQLNDSTAGFRLDQMFFQSSDGIDHLLTV